MNIVELLNQLNFTTLFLIFIVSKLFFETYFMTRNKDEDVKYSAYNLKNKIKFRLLEFKAGARFPFYGTQFELFSSWAQYRASIKENIKERPEIRSGYGYEYFKGSQLGINWFMQRYKQRVDRAINPIGFRFHISAAREFNQFIEGLDLSDSGTLTSTFGNHDLFRTKIDSEYSFDIPNTNRSSIKIGAKIGAFSTILLIFITAITGIIYARYEGLNTLRSAYSQIIKQETPAYEIISGAAIAFAALLLIIPGFATDIIGFLIILPITRKLILGKVSTKIKKVLEIVESVEDPVKQISLKQAGNLDKKNKN
mgnify:CR=1 FL=1